MTARGKQANMLTTEHEVCILQHLRTTRYPVRGQVMFLLSVKAGLRAKDIAALTWAMVTDATGQVGEVLHLGHRARTGNEGDGTLPLHRDLRAALITLYQGRDAPPNPARPVLLSERGGGLAASSVQLWFYRLYRTLGLSGCSSHSGRRTFITRAASKVAEAGGTLRDVQQLAGHSSLATTQRYIEGNTDAKRKLVQML